MPFLSDLGLIEELLFYFRREGALVDPYPGGTWIDAHPFAPYALHGVLAEVRIADGLSPAAGSFWIAAHSGMDKALGGVISGGRPGQLIEVFGCGVGIDAGVVVEELSDDFVF